MPAKSRRRRVLFRLLFVAFVLAMGLLIAEVSLRLVWTLPDRFYVFGTAPSWQEPEPGCFEPIASSVGGFQEALPQDAPPSARFTPRVLEMRINSQGLRGPELGSKQPGERRILFGGDSLTFGHAVAEDESYPAITGRLLRERGANVSIGNAGVPGYGFVATCKRLHRLASRTEADVLVAAYFLGNDFMDDIDQRSCTVVGGRLFGGPFGNLLRDSWRARLAVHSRLALFFETWLVDCAPESSLLPWCVLSPEQSTRHRALPPGATVGGLFLDAPLEHCFAADVEPVTKLWRADFEEALRTLQHDAGRLPVFLVVLPSQYQVDAELREKVLAEVHLDRGLLKPGSAQQRLLEVCEALRIPCLDATPLLAAGGNPAAFFHIDHVHLSVRGNEIVARGLAERLTPLLH